MRALRKGQASPFNITRDIRGEAAWSSVPSVLAPLPLAERIDRQSSPLEFEAA